MIPAVIATWQNQRNSITEQARIRALTIYQMIVVTRQWVAENRDRIEPVPAQATKELSQYADYMADFKFHISSNILVNEENAPDSFEIRAIDALNNGAEEYSEIYNIPDMGDVYRFAASLTINKSCMPCHAGQGYKIDDFRGLISVIIPLADLEESIKKGNRTLIFTVFTGLAGIIIIVCLLLYKLVLYPIGMLTDAVGKIRRGNYNVKTEIKTNDEIQELSEAFDTMSAQIAENEDTLKAKLDEAVKKYIDLVGELEEKNAQLDSLNQLKTDFLDSVAHEIRTPLTKIMSYTELLNDPRLADDTASRAKFADSLKRNVTSMTGMFNDIITMRRLEYDQHPYHRIPVALKEMITVILDNFERESTEKQLKIEINIDENLIALVDGESFGYAMSNIISNAVKYSEKNGKIVIKAAKTDDKIIMSCWDEGVGIPQEDLAHVFKRFHRGSNVKREYPGTGLGLAIVDRVINAHEGKMEIFSEEGKYTEVRLTL
jgi:signal transduction histidine kinase